MNSKYSYLLCGVNITFAFVGAMAGSFSLMAIGAIFTVWNWYAGEFRRKMEELELTKKEQDNDENNEESK